VASFSVTSTGMLRVFIGKQRHEGPSCRELAPKPPMCAEIAMNERPSLLRPCRYISLAGQPPLPARTSSGMTGSSAPKMISGNRCEIIVRPQVDAGCRQFTIEPSSAVTVIGWSAPALLGTSGSRASLIG
jgi:hypothetical protein